MKITDNDPLLKKFAFELHFLGWPSYYMSPFDKQKSCREIFIFVLLQVEWMSDKVMKSFEIGRMNPYQFRFVNHVHGRGSYFVLFCLISCSIVNYVPFCRHCQLCHSLADLAKISEPKVVLASVADLTCGFSRELFIKWAEEPRNTVVFTCRPSPGTLARTLIENLQLKAVDIEVKLELFSHLKIIRCD